MKINGCVPKTVEDRHKGDGEEERRNSVEKNTVEDWYKAGEHGKSRRSQNKERKITITKSVTIKLSSFSP